jgi:hypothetical protein
LKIIAVVSVLAVAFLAGCTVTPHIGIGYGKHGHHYGYRHGHHHHGHIPPGHWKRRHH